jgi:hypothetical protein
MITSKALTKMGLEHNIIVEPQEVQKYEKAVKDLGLLTTVIPLDMSYKEKYELCDDLGLTKSTGSGPARNFAWDHSISEGAEYHWIMDDNIRDFRRYNYNEKVKCVSPRFFEPMEDFCLRYENVAMAGPNYYMFIAARTPVAPFTLNTRIYSCNFIRNDIPFRWRGRYNEDTILSLDILKAGWCTILFNALLQRKMPTQTLAGGNTAELYQGDTRDSGEKYAKKGTIDKSQMLALVHPDVTKIAYKFSRIHHEVDYSRFKYNRLKKKPGVVIKPGIDNYSMVLQQQEVV